MRIFFVTAGVTAAATAYAGGVVGGNPGLAYMDKLQEVSLIDKLPKSYVPTDIYKRTLMRLSPEGVKTVPMMLRGQYIDVARVNDRIIDASITSEVLPVDLSKEVLLSD